MNSKKGLVIGLALLLLATVFIVVGGMLTESDDLNYETADTEETEILPDEDAQVEMQKQFIAAADLDNQLSENPDAALIDVRNPDELEEGKIAGSVNIPLPELVPAELPDRIPGLEQDHKIYVYCRSGGRSERAMERLIRAGYTNVVSVDGGYSAYQAHVNKN